MPTGYTHAVADGTVSDLRTFALVCARGMGALVTMRDDPSNAEIPRRFEIDTEYRDAKISDARRRLEDLSAMSKDDIVAACDVYNEKVAADRRKRVEDNNAQHARYVAMIVQVEQWTGAPEGLRDFMLRQLRDSLDFDCPKDPTKYMPSPKLPDEWHAGEMEAAQRDIRYHEQQRVEEIERIKARNAWLDQLFAALPAITDDPR